MTSLILMGYEDFWDESKGEYWSLQSMTLDQKVAYLLWYVVHFPFGLIVPKGFFNIVSVCLLTPVIIGWSILRLAKDRAAKFKRYGIMVNAFVLIMMIGTFILLFN